MNPGSSPGGCIFKDVTLNIGVKMKLSKKSKIIRYYTYLLERYGYKDGPDSKVSGCWMFWTMLLMTLWLPIYSLSYPLTRFGEFIVRLHNVWKLKSFKGFNVDRKELSFPYGLKVFLYDEFEEQFEEQCFSLGMLGAIIFLCFLLLLFVSYAIISSGDLTVGIIPLFYALLLATFVLSPKLIGVIVVAMLEFVIRMFVYLGEKICPTVEIISDEDSSKES
jgi:hypothetical protein